MTTSNFPPSIKLQIIEDLSFLYGQQQADALVDRIQKILETYAPAMQTLEAKPLTEKDVVLITYADQLSSPDKSPLKTLGTFLSNYLSEFITTVHILPFYPFSSDDGFSVIDYRQVNPEFGDWEDVEHIGETFTLMFDAVINHISANSNWFQGFLRNEPPFNRYFITVDPAADLSSVVRPRDLPLLTPFQTPEGERHLWTTFSTDQIDLNFKNPAVLLEILDLLLYYVSKGARIIRLDAIAFLWKEIGTSSIHLPQTHHLIKLMRLIIEQVAPHVLLLTETNVPHAENISYFGEGDDEAHMVYQFALPPLILHTLISGDSSRISDWAASLQRPSDEVTYFNFTASHDGIGVRPARDLLTDQEIDNLIKVVQDHGGGISYRRVGVDERQAYELNINYFDALNHPAELEEDPRRCIDRFLCSQAIMLSIPGLPAIYFHSLFGSRNDLLGVEKTGHLRSINREKLSLMPFESEIVASGTRRNLVFDGYQRLIKTRASHPAFTPWGDHKILKLGSQVFAILRFNPQVNSKLLCLHEISGQELVIDATLEGRLPSSGSDMLTNQDIALTKVSMRPYQVRWIRLNECK
jgi:sucrose phosphorylase